MRRRTGRRQEVHAIVVAVGIAFFAWGVAVERVASVWPAARASKRPLSLRTAAMGLVAAAAAAGVVARSELPVWGTAAYLALLALLLALAATDLEQRLLPHALLDPLILGALAFVPVNPAVPWQSALGGAAIAVAVLGGLGLAMRGGIAAGDLYLAVPIGLFLGVTATFTALLVAAVLAGGVSALLLLVRRASLKTYIPFGPFLVAGAIAALLTGPELSRAAAAHLLLALR